MTSGSARLACIALTSCLAFGGTVALGQAPEIVLRYLTSVPIAKGSHGLHEASGLVVSPGGSGLLAIDDGSGRIVTLSPDGPNKGSAVIETGLEDLEGLAQWQDGTFLMVQENTASLILFTPGNGTRQAHSVGKMAGFDQIAIAFAGEDQNDGLEGVTVRATDGAVLVLKERRPRLLVTISPDLTKILSAVELTAALGFQSDVADDRDLDLADIAHDPLRGGFWLISDTGSALYYLPEAGGPARAWPLTSDSGRIFNGEGIALSADGRTLWVVTDAGKNSRLYTYSLAP